MSNLDLSKISLAISLVDIIEEKLVVSRCIFSFLQFKITFLRLRGVYNFVGPPVPESLSLEGLGACLHINLSKRDLSIPLNILVPFSVQFSVDMVCVFREEVHIFI